MNQCPTLTQTRVPEFELDSLLAQNRCERAQRLVEAHPLDYTDEDRYQVGKCFYRTANFSQSQVVMEGLAHRATLWSDVRAKVDYALGKLAEREGDIAAALGHYERRIAHTDPDAIDALCALAKLGAQETGQTRPFDSTIEYIVGTGHSSEIAWKCVASYALQSPTLSRAAELADWSCRALLQFPNWREDPWTCLSNQVQRRFAEDPDRVMMELRTLQGEKDRYIESQFQAKAAGLLMRLEKSPGDPDALHDLARAYYEHRDFAQAAEVWEILASQVEGGAHSEIMRHMAMAWLRAGDKPRARQILKETHQWVPSDFHRLEGVAQVAAQAAVQDYSRVGGATAQKFEPLFTACESHLQIYPEGVAFLYFRERANWRIQEARQRPELIVTEHTETLRRIGGQWKSRLSALVLTEAALSYLHRGKLSLSSDHLARHAVTDFDTAEEILLDVLSHREEFLRRNDQVNIYNTMEAWLSYGWSKYNRGEFENADGVFTVIMAAPQIQPKQLVEAYRGAGASRDRLARKAFGRGALETAQRLAAEAVALHEKGVELAEPYIGKNPQPLLYEAVDAVFEGRRDAVLAEEEALIGQSLVTYVGYFDPAVFNEQRFNLAVARYWQAKILRGSQKQDEALRVYAQAQKEFERVVRAAPDHPESYRFLEYIAIAQGDLDRAVGYYKEARRLGTGQLPDAILKLLDGLDGELASEDLSTERLARRRGYLWMRADLAKELAQLTRDPRHRERAKQYARSLPR